MAEVEPKYAETSYTVDPNSPIPDDAPPAAGTTDEEAEAIKELQDGAVETQQSEAEQAQQKQAERSDPDRELPKPSEFAEAQLPRSEDPQYPEGETVPEGPVKDEGPVTPDTESVQANPDTQTTTLPSEVQPGSPVEEEEVPEGTATEVLDWVGDDPDRAQQALDAERAGKNRSTLISQLEERGAQ